MKLRLLALTLTAIVLTGCAISVQPSPVATPTAKPIPTSTVGAWDVDMTLINEADAAGTVSFTFADGHTKVINFTEPAQDFTEKDLVLVGQSVTVEVNVSKPPKERYLVCTISAFKLTVATEGGGTLDSNTGTGKFTCTWTNDGTVVMPEPEE